MTKKIIFVRKHRLIHVSTTLHGVTFPKIVIFILTTVRTSSIRNSDNDNNKNTSQVARKWKRNIELPAKANSKKQEFSQHRAMLYTDRRRNSWMSWSGGDCSPLRVCTWHWAVKGTHTARHSHPVASLWRPAIFHCHVCFLQPTYHVQSPHSIDWSPGNLTNIMLTEFEDSNPLIGMLVIDHDSDLVPSECIWTKILSTPFNVVSRCFHQNPVQCLLFLSIWATFFHVSLS
jgi:hypothetical protein